MKAILTLLILGGLVLGGVYYFGGYKSFDPTKQGRDAKAAIQPGMTLKQVVDIAGGNPKYQPINTFTRKVGNQTIEEKRPGLSVDFKQDRVTQQVNQNALPKGFILNYMYSEQIAFDVHFDASGRVTHVTDAMTMGTLLNQ